MGKKEEDNKDSLIVAFTLRKNREWKSIIVTCKKYRKLVKTEEKFINHSDIISEYSMIALQSNQKKYKNNNHTIKK